MRTPIPCMSPARLRCSTRSRSFPQRTSSRTSPEDVQPPDEPRWGDKEHEIPFDIYHPATRRVRVRHVRAVAQGQPAGGCRAFHDVLHQFTLLFDQKQREGRSWTGFRLRLHREPGPLDDFEKEYGYRLRPEDFVDGGAYNSAWRVPRKAQRDWIDFLSGFVRANVKKLADMSHKAGKEAMMFLGDQWIGTEPYKDSFRGSGLDAVVSSIGDGTTTRMIADIPGVNTRGRFLPYFFPTRSRGTAIRASKVSTAGARPVVRHPFPDFAHGLRRYLSPWPRSSREFVDTIHPTSPDEFATSRPCRWSRRRRAPRRQRGDPELVGAEMRSWMAFTVAHALPNKQTARSYYGILESLSGHACERAVHQLR